MPMLVRTPEDILRAQKKDLYIIRSSEDEPRNAHGLRMIREWIDQHLPGTHTELIGPSAHSGFIEGGIGRDIWVDFSPEGLARFCAQWEKDNTSIDPRFQCFVMPYQRWWQEQGRFLPTLERPTGIGPTLWWYTPIGFVHHQLAVEDQTCPETRCHHPSTVEDIWAQAAEKWPELAALDRGALPYGSIWQHANGTWHARVVPPVPWTGRLLVLTTHQNIQDWFGLPPEVEIYDDEF